MPGDGAMTSGAAAELARRIRHGEDSALELLTISLGEPFDDHCYKLIAAVVEDA